jgi:hypothetical protein
MSYDVFWDNEKKTIIRQLFNSTTTIDEYYKLIDTTHEMQLSVDYPVDVIMHFESVNMRATGLFPAAMYTARTLPKNRRITIVVGANDYLRAMLGSVKQILPWLFKLTYFVSTLEEAHQIIHDYENSQNNAGS